MTGRVAGRVAVVSGATRGQGRSHAVRLAQERADMIAIDVCGPIDNLAHPHFTPADLDESRYVTGVSLPVDAGALLK
ncbi:MAG: 3-ketoacyl-ACP reductase [Mycobacterium sp.]|jgi:hypothetical protein|nr:3-ketoacyl-ACP reductase [Mycobacterium sp.]